VRDSASTFAEHVGHLPCVTVLAVTCIIMQKNGAGLHTTATTYWDTKKDGAWFASVGSLGGEAHLLASLVPGFCKVPWENSTMHCIVTVYGLAIEPSPTGGDMY